MTRLASSNRSRSVRTSLPLCVLLLALATSGCNCAVGEPLTQTDAYVPPMDMGTDSYVPPMDMGTDSYVPPVDMGMGVDAGTNMTCGDGYIAGTELGEVCDPAATGVIPELMCQCPDDGNLCTDDVWVPDPVLGVCFGSCQHPTRTDFMATTCGMGVCASTGNTFCSNNTIMDSCTPGTPTGADDDCNGVDEDCDGMADDGYVETPTSCGMGACGSSGMLTCPLGATAPVDTCVAGNPTALDNNCNGMDENCDGTDDDGYQAVQTNCGLGVCASMGSTSCPSGSPVDSCTPGMPTAADDVTCNLIDEDCSGQADEDYVGAATMCGVGACRAVGVQVCQHPMGGGFVIGDTCTPSMPQAELCDNLDNDCDGTLNDGNPGGGGNCNTMLQGVCAQGMINCITDVMAGTGFLQCVQNVMPSVEICDGLDNNCDGMVDNIAATSCTTSGLGVCMAGVAACMGNTQICMQVTPSSAEVCDGLDNDCDGTVNDGNPGGGAACVSIYPGVCSAGTLFCDNTVTTPTCRATILPGAQTEICDGIDNDCNGSTDTNALVPEAIGNSCGTAGTRTVSVAPGGSTTVSGTVDTSGDDYFTVNFTATGAAGTRYHPLITLTNNAGGQYVINVLNGSCAATSCGGDVQSYEALYPASPMNCATLGMNCTDQTARTLTYIVRVKRAGTGPTNCNSYTVTVSNI